MHRSLTVILAAPESDAHVVSLKLLECALDEKGYSVVNLGVCRPAREIAEAAAEVAVFGGLVVVFLSCQNGHGLADLFDLHQRLETLGKAEAVHVYAGGHLAVGVEAGPEAVRLAYKAIGITVLGSFEEGFAELERLVQMNNIPSPVPSNAAAVVDD